MSACLRKRSARVGHSGLRIVECGMRIEELFDELRRYFTEPEIMDLGWRIVTFVGYGRFIHTLGLEIGKTCPLA